MQWRIGTMGWSYPDWVGTFYPTGTKAGEFLSLYSRHFDAIEVDSTYHALPDRARVRRWAEQTPDGFRFAVKTPAAVTHEGTIDRNLPIMLDFLSVMEQLEQKLAVVLIQLPPTFAITEFGRLTRLLDGLPVGDGRPRYAVEFRHASWRRRDVVQMLRDRRIAWVAIDYVGHHAEIVPTTDFLYLRLIGQHDRFDYKGKEQVEVDTHLEWWAEQIGVRSEKQPLSAVWTLFNNDYSGHSPAAADRFRRMVGLAVPEAIKPRQGELF